ncbi:hypothetical protein B0H13DRAFT_1928089 [Mycena leptocephala]|nr:hypothetical protein B0H13DRAFT_1928089 [Mycena leptocephala]
MGDATRKEFLRRIRIEVPETGLRYVVEHLWLRGLLSGTITASGSGKNSTKPDPKKLADALLAGQLNVKNLIETKWNRQEFIAGMTGCARTWLNQMVNKMVSVTMIFSSLNSIRPKIVAPQSRHRNSQDPIRHSDNHRTDPLAPNLSCPLTLNMGFDVEYTLIARVICLEGEPGTDNTYIYNDLRREGSLTELGPLHLLEDHDAQTSWVLYLRTSKASITSRTVAEIQTDFERLPPPSNEFVLIEDSDNEVDEMIIDAITSPAKHKSGTMDQFYTPEQSPAPAPLDDAQDMIMNTSLAETNSTAPCPIRCQPCGTNLPEGDDDPDEVQCGKCKFWSHFKCYPGVDWNDPEERFFCAPCREEITAEFYRPGEVVLLPDPGVIDWREPEVQWYPARFIQHHKKRKGQVNEYEFQWLECLDGILYDSELSNLPALILRTQFRARKFVQEISGVTLTANQIAQILADWDDRHPAIKSFNAYFSGKKNHLRSRQAADWMRTWVWLQHPNSRPSFRSLINVMGHSDLLGLTHEECHARVMGLSMNSDEPLNLNGDLFEDLLDKLNSDRRCFVATAHLTCYRVTPFQLSLEAVELKRRADDEPEDEKPKPAKLTKTGKEGRTAKTSRSDQMVATSTPRRLRSGKVV